MDLVAPQHVEFSWTRDWTSVPRVARQILSDHWTTREALASVTLSLKTVNMYSAWFHEDLRGTDACFFIFRAFSVLLNNSSKRSSTLPDTLSFLLLFLENFCFWKEQSLPLGTATGNRQGGCCDQVKNRRMCRCLLVTHDHVPCQLTSVLRATFCLSFLL